MSAQDDQAATGKAMSKYPAALNIFKFNVILLWQFASYITQFKEKGQSIIHVFPVKFCFSLTLHEGSPGEMSDRALSYSAPYLWNLFLKTIRKVGGAIEI